MNKLSLSIVEDYLLNRIYYKSLVENEQNYYVTGHYSNIKEFIKNMISNPTDYIFIDLELNNFKNLYILSVLKICFPRTKIIILASKNKEKNILNAFQYGIKGYILKENCNIVKLLKNADENEFLLSFRFFEKLLNKISPQPIEFISKKDNIGLTDREMQVLKLLTQGKTNSQIANEITVSTNTAKAHVASIFDKLSVNDRVQATVKAIKENLL